MHVDASDLRPRSLLDRAEADPAQLLSGLAAALAVHVALPLTVGAVVAALSAVGVVLSAPVAETPPPVVEQVIQAHFIQRGEVLDPRLLPNRQVPVLRTDVPDPAPNAHSNAEPVPSQTRQREAVADVLQRITDQAQIFAEREEARVLEGDPDGVEGGEREASEGDRYAGTLAVFFRRGWQVPTTLDRDELRAMIAAVSVHITDELRVESFRLVRSSGDADFDLSVTQQLQRLVDAQATIPPPPEEVASTYLGREVGFRYHGRDAR